jgi:hypothetical protein
MQPHKGHGQIEGHPNVGRKFHKIINSYTCTSRKHYTGASGILWEQFSNFHIGMLDPEKCGL